MVGKRIRTSPILLDFQGVPGFVLIITYGHTYGTRLAEMNTPTHILCNQMGHASGKVTERYYLAVSKSGIDILTANLNAM